MTHTITMNVYARHSVFIHIDRGGDTWYNSKHFTIETQIGSPSWARLAPHLNKITPERSDDIAPILGDYYLSLTYRIS